MREKDIHDLIERQDPEAKQRIWEKVCAQIDVGEAQVTQPTAVRKVNSSKLWKWVTATVVAVIVVALSITLPLVLKDDGMRYCDSEKYTTEPLTQTLGEYFTEHNKNLLYVDLYDGADETITEYGYNRDNKKDVIYYSETLLFVKGETIETIKLSITNNKTRVDIFSYYYEATDITSSTIKNITVQWTINSSRLLARFDYQGHTYYLELNSGDQARLTQIIEDMLK